MIYMHPDNGKPSLLGFYGHFSLAFKVSIQHHQLPSRRSFRCIYSIFSAKKLYIFNHIAYVKEPCFCTSYLNITMCYETVLGKMGSKCNSSLVSVFNLNIDIGQSTVKGTCTGILNDSC